MKDEPVLYGLLAEYLTPEDIVAAAEAAHAAGYRQLGAYSPFPVEGLAEATGFTTNRMPLVVLVGGLLGGATGYFMQWFSAVIHYPINVGGRGLHSWPAFIPITFELTVLGAATAAVFGMLALNGLPQPYHPLFNDPSFAMATRSRFFLCIAADDPHFDLEGTRRFLAETGPKQVTEVPR